jgi:hypothetical protein
VSRPQTVRNPKETPMERIFFKITGRKMTPREKGMFHLNGKNKSSLRNGSNGAGARKNEARN